MESNISTKEFAEKVMEGLRIAVKKVYEDAKKNKRPLAITVDGKVKLIYP